APATLVVDGEEIHDPTTLPDARWAHIQEVGGYVLLRPGTVAAGVTRRVGSTVRVERDAEAIPRDQRADRGWAALDRHTPGPTGGSGGGRRGPAPLRAGGGGLDAPAGRFPGGDARPGWPAPRR